MIQFTSLCVGNRETGMLTGPVASGFFLMIKISGVVFGISYKAFTVQRATWFPLVTFSFLRRRSARTASILRPFQLIVPTRRKRNDAAILSKLHFPYLCAMICSYSIYSMKGKNTRTMIRETQLKFGFSVA